MKTTPLSFLTSGMLLLPGLCQAAPRQPEMESQKEPPKAEKGGPPRPGRDFLELWKAADADRDGFISKAEFALMPRIEKLPDEKRDLLFGRLDKDGDLKLSREELIRFGKPRDGRADPAAKRLWELDFDKSGGISFEEFKGGEFFSKLPAEKQQVLFDRLDTDHDGLITPQDRPKPSIKGPDGNQRPHRPGGVPPESENGPNPINRKLDANGDGSLSFEEFRVGPAVKDLNEDEQEDRFEFLDRNNDQKLSPEDFPPPQPTE